MEIAVKLNDISVFLENEWSLRNPFGRNKKGVWSLKNMSFEIEDGQVFGIIGRNGAGKTTLLRTIAGIIQPDQGTVWTFGRKASLLSLSPGFMSELSGRENAELAGLVIGGDWKKAKENIELVKNFSELDDAFEQPISSYSSGMLSRLGFAIAFYNSPNLVLMDEVLSVGDVSFKEKSKKAMHDFLKNRNKTILLVSNNPKTITDFAKQAMWIEKGQIVMKGTAKDVAKAYQNFSMQYRKYIDSGLAPAKAAEKALDNR